MGCNVVQWLTMVGSDLGSILYVPPNTVHNIHKYLTPVKILDVIYLLKISRNEVNNVKQ